MNTENPLHSNALKEMEACVKCIRFIFNGEENIWSIKMRDKLGPANQEVSYCPRQSQRLIYAQ